MFSAWADALQSTLASAQEAVTSAQEVAYEASKDFFAMENAQDEEPAGVVQGGVGKSSSLSCAVDELLSAPSGIASQHWCIVLDVAFNDENFFVIPVDRILERSRESLARIGILDACRSVPTHREIDPHTLSPLAANEAISRMHYGVMPRFVTDDQFWQHCLWRLAVLRLCTSVNQLVDTYELLTLETDFVEPRLRLHGVNNSSQCSALRSRVVDAQSSVDWVNEKQRVVDEALRNAGGSCQLLATFIAKRERTDLSDSVFESCKYHKTKLAGLIGELENNASRVDGTDLSPFSQTCPGGARFNELLQQNVGLSEGIASYVGVLDALATASQAGPMGHTQSPSALALATSSAAAAPGDQSSAPPVSATVVSTSPAQDILPEVVVRDTVGDDDDEFSVKLPWDDDEDD